MAKASIRIKCEACGQEFTHRKDCWNRDEAEKYEEWARDNITVCPACYAKAMRAAERAKIDAATAAAREEIGEMQFSELEGSEKQIAWAQDIRARAAAICKKAGATEKFWALFNEKTSAKWWIDNREFMDIGARTIVKMIVQG